VSEPDDAALLEAWRGGDNEAGNTLVKRRIGEITRFFRNKVGSESDVADLVSQTFLGCVTGKDTFRGETSFRRFVFQIAQNVLWSYVRKRDKREREAGDFATVCVQELHPGSLSSIVTRKLEAHVLVQSLREVPLEDQIVLELMYLEGLTGPQIAEVLDIPEGTVRGRIRRGLGRLRERVERSLAFANPRQAPSVTLEDVEAWAQELRGHTDVGD
jgi:RNA polymerase sigma-70 factor (ECF subfamily)